MSYKVKINVFEGPFDLLVYLIENAEMNIYDIKISEITGQYIAHIEEMRMNNMDVASEFLVLAATLIEIKSKMLLPRYHKEEEVEPLDDPRKDLIDKLLEYKKFKNASKFLELQQENKSNIFYKPKEDLSQYSKEPVEIFDGDLDSFVRAFHLLLMKKKRMEEIKRTYGETAKEERFTVKEMIDIIRRKTVGKRETTFRILMQECNNRYEVVVAFIAVLNMMRDGEVVVEQDKNFEDIIILGGSK